MFSCQDKISDFPKAGADLLVFDPFQAGFGFLNVIFCHIIVGLVTFILLNI